MANGTNGSSEAGITGFDILAMMQERERGN
jgi:hypothetical protein